MSASLLRESAARRFKTLGHPARLRLIELLARGAKSVSELSQLTGLPPDAVSKHLRALAAVRLVRRSQCGNFARYAIGDPELYRLVALGYRGVVREVRRLEGIAELAETNGAGTSPSNQDAGRVEDASSMAA